VQSAALVDGTERHVVMVGRTGPENEACAGLAPLVREAGIRIHLLAPHDAGAASERLCAETGGLRIWLEREEDSGAALERTRLLLAPQYLVRYRAEGAMADKIEIYSEAGCGGVPVPQAA